MLYIKSIKTIIQVIKAIETKKSSIRIKVFYKLNNTWASNSPFHPQSPQDAFSMHIFTNASQLGLKWTSINVHIVPYESSPYPIRFVIGVQLYTTHAKRCWQNSSHLCPWPCWMKVTNGFGKQKRHATLHPAQVIYLTIQKPHMIYWNSSEPFFVFSFCCLVIYRIVFIYYLLWYTCPISCTSIHTSLYSDY